MAHALLGLVQTMCLIGFAPVVQGIVKKVKALLQGRHGPPVFQPYYDLRKYFRKDEAVSEHASWLFLTAPYVVFAATVTVATMIPAFMTQTLSDFTSDIVLVVFLFGLARFFTALAGIDTGSSFGAMGSSRDMFVSAFAEPTLFITMLALALPFGTTNLTRIADEVASNRLLLVSPAFYMVFLALFILVITETGRIPVDNPDTHLELTMIHEGMLLEYSGKRLGLMLWSAWIKQMLLFALLIDFCLPWGISTGANGLMVAAGLVLFLLKVLLVAVVVACTEMSYAKIRFFRIPRLLSAAFALSVLAIATESLL